MSVSIFPKPATQLLTPQRFTLRVITTAQGICFEVFGETAHYVMCKLPPGSSSAADALAGFEGMAEMGYFICHHLQVPDRYHSCLTFEKRGEALAKP